MKYYQIGEKVAIRKAFGEAFYEVAKDDPRLVAVSADLASSLNLTKFGQDFPGRLFICGVAEQNMIGIAAGLAIQGFVPFAGTFGCFLGRTIDHVRQSIGHNQVNVKIVGSHGGVSNAQDGPSAHALEDLAMFRALPKMAVVVVADANQVFKATKAVAEYPTSVYLRLYREPLPVFIDEAAPFVIGKANLMRKGQDVSLIACGPHVGLCLEVAAEIEKELSLEVIDCHTLSPIDQETIVGSAKKTNSVVTVEDHNINGGLGSAVAEVLSENYPTPLIRMGLTNFATSGNYQDVIKAVGIGKEDIKRTVKEAVSQKRQA